MNYTILVQGGLQAVDAKAETDSKEIYDPKFFWRLSCAGNKYALTNMYDEYILSIKRATVLGYPNK